jgi:hypothetical protein
LSGSLICASFSVGVALLEFTSLLAAAIGTGVAGRHDALICGVPFGNLRLQALNSVRAASRRALFFLSPSAFAIHRHRP